MKTVDFNIEYAHVYATDLDGDLSKVRKNVEKTKILLETIKANNASFSLSVLVDDYSDNQWAIPQDDIRKLFSKLGLEPDHVVMESELSKEADSLLRSLPDKYLIQEEGRYIFRSESKDIHFAELLTDKRRYKSMLMDKMRMGEAAWNEMQKKKLLNLKQERVHSQSNLIVYYNDGKVARYSCPLLAACWYLARLGVEPFYSSIKNSLNPEKLFLGKNIITVLPITFLKVEATAVELISMCKSKTISKSRRRIEYYFTS